MRQQTMSAATWMVAIEGEIPEMGVCAPSLARRSRRGTSPFSRPNTLVASGRATPQPSSRRYSCSRRDRRVGASAAEDFDRVMASALTANRRQLTDPQLDTKVRPASAANERSIVCTLGKTARIVSYVTSQHHQWPTCAKSDNGRAKKGTLTSKVFRVTDAVPPHGRREQAYCIPKVIP
ncbi:hypothetical protein P171DRAFT_501858 [Karstenula rhodostoma CBS 690.94]|uniref:Uncharacterized protein n=1 Tax=Karstenula rhodostoma CBS 690.94 TaxID=1392251 RepID=A0A9P4U7W9_9PLEO|nr:hypothetical protein P171DRAFT_501858 [Karstenula rhodostoma CBS 690.94]